MFFCIFAYALTIYVSSDLILDHEREDVQVFFRCMCTGTMLLCLMLFLLLIICYVKTLVDGAKAEEQKEVLRRSIIEMAKSSEEGIRGHSVIEYFSNPIKLSMDAPPSPTSSPRLEEGNKEKTPKKSKTPKTAKTKGKTRRVKTPPPNTKVFGTWWELVSEDGKPYYYNHKENYTQWERPKGWVKFMATERFNGGEVAMI